MAGGKGFLVGGDGDAGECEGFTPVARDVDLFTCEAAFPDGHPVDGHLTPNMAGGGEVVLAEDLMRFDLGG